MRKHWKALLGIALSAAVMIAAVIPNIHAEEKDDSVSGTLKNEWTENTITLYEENEDGERFNIYQIENELDAFEDICKGKNSYYALFSSTLDTGYGNGASLRIVSYDDSFDRQESTDCLLSELSDISVFKNADLFWHNGYLYVSMIGRMTGSGLDGDFYAEEVLVYRSDSMKLLNSGIRIFDESNASNMTSNLLEIDDHVYVMTTDLKERTFELSEVTSGAGMLLTTAQKVYSIDENAVYYEACLKAVIDSQMIPAPECSDEQEEESEEDTEEEETEEEDTEEAESDENDEETVIESSDEADTSDDPETDSTETETEAESASIEIEETETESIPEEAVPSENESIFEETEQEDDSETETAVEDDLTETAEDETAEENSREEASEESFPEENESIEEFETFEETENIEVIVIIEEDEISEESESTEETEVVSETGNDSESASDNEASEAINDSYDITEASEESEVGDETGLIDVTETSDGMEEPEETEEIAYH